MARTACWWSSWSCCRNPLPPPSPTWRQSRSRPTTWYLPHIAFIFNRICFVFFLSQMQVFYFNACSHTQYSYNEKKVNDIHQHDLRVAPDRKHGTYPTYHSFVFFWYFFGGLECVGHSFAYVAHFVVLRDVRTQRAAVASSHPFRYHLFSSSFLFFILKSFCWYEATLCFLHHIHSYTFI